MSAKDFAALAVSNGKSIRQAAKLYGIPNATLRDHINLINRPEYADPGHKEFLIEEAVKAVDAKRLTIYMAAKLYGISHRTLRARAKKRQSKKGRPFKFTEDEEHTLVDILIKLVKLNVGLTKFGLIKLLAEIG